MAPGSDAKHLIVGTAGHVYHGKTTLILAMTGINTDRLKEEQERGLTINLGFASLKLPSGRTVGIVDVPGHERFLKNMLAGASGVDIALLVVAADEGVMPQTKEHIDILQLLESKQGVVALTKSDAVEEDWLQVVEDYLRDYLADTFLANAKIVRVSGITGQGIDELTREIDVLAEAAEQRPIEGPFRLPIDRVFTMTGFGTVVTGTLVSGTLKLGDPVRILPKGIDTRVRGIQVHGKKQEAAQAGSRVAVNLAGVEVAEIERGDVLLPPGYLSASRVLDVSVRVLEDATRPLSTRTRIRLHIGTAEVIGRAIVFRDLSAAEIPKHPQDLSAAEIPKHQREIEPGKSGFVQLRLESPVVAARGDRFVLRFYSPMRVLGGGIVLDPAAARHRASEKNVIERLERKLKGDPVDIVEDTLAIREAGLPAEQIAQITALSAGEVSKALEELTRAGRVLQAGSRFLHRGTCESVTARAKSILGAYFEANPMKSGMPKEEFRRHLGPAMDAKGFQALLTPMSAAGDVTVSEATVNLPGHVPTLGENEQRLASSIETAYHEAGANPPLLTELEQRHGAIAKDIAAYLLERGNLVKIEADILFHREVIESAENVLRKYLEPGGQMTVAQFRDLIGSSRKYVVPLLEYFDKKRVTRRVGDMRVLVR